jgi:phosphoglycerate dehydrogenase-like enzyme
MCLSKSKQVRNNSQVLKLQAKFWCALVLAQFARIANDAYRLGMHVYGYDPYVSIETAWNISVTSVVSTTSKIFSETVITSRFVPLTEETKATFNREAFDVMGKT